MKVGIVLSIDGKDTKVSILDAQDIYFELQKLFDRGMQNMNNQVKKDNKTVNREINKSVNKDTEINKRMNKPIEYANPIVEAAKKRAEKRTSGCGTRR